MDREYKEVVDEFRFKLLVPLVTEFTCLKGKAVLDFGCGIGKSSFALALEGADVTGIDISDSAIRTATEIGNNHFRDLSTEFLFVQNSTELPFANHSFDISTCNAVFEHILPHVRSAHFREIVRVTKPGGFIIIRGTPNRLFPKDGHTSELWLVPYMPLGLAKYYVLCRNGAIKKSDELSKKKASIREKLKMIPHNEWLVRGIRGVSYNDIQRWQKSCSSQIWLVNNDPKREIDRYLSSSSTFDKSYRTIFAVIKIFFLSIGFLNCSIHIFLPYLNLVYQIAPDYPKSH